MTAADEIPAGWLTQFRRGASAGFVLLAVASLLVAIPTFLAWLAPGADSTSAGSALRLAVLVTITGNHGGLVIDGTAVTLTPLLVTGLLVWLAANHAKRLATNTSFAGLVVGYPIAVALAAHWSRLGTTHAPVGSSALAALLLVGLAGGTARFGPMAWRRVPARWQRAGRAGAGAAASYLAAGSLLAAAALADHFSRSGDLQGRLMTGTAGLPIALLGIAAVPNATLHAVGYLTGAGFDLGSHTHIAPLITERGTLPAFPLLAAVPSGHPAWIGFVAGGATAVAAGVVCHRLLAARPTGGVTGRSFASHALEVLVAACGAATILGCAGILASGSIGSTSLRHVGVTGWLVAACALGSITLTAMLSLGLSWLWHMFHRRPVASVVPFVSKQAAEPTDEAANTAESAVLVDSAPVPSGTTEPDDSPATQPVPVGDAGASHDEARNGDTDRDTDRAQGALRSTG